MTSSSYGPPASVPSTVSPKPSGSSTANVRLALHYRLQTSHSTLAHFVIPLSAFSPQSYVSGCFSRLPVPFSSPVSFQVLQWNTRSFRARSAELLHFNSLHSVELICGQNSNLILSSSFRILIYPALCGLFALTSGLAFFHQMTGRP